MWCTPGGQFDGSDFSYILGVSHNDALQVAVLMTINPHQSQL